MHSKASRWGGSVSHAHYRHIQALMASRTAETVQSGKQPGKNVAAYKILLQLGLVK